MSQPREVIPTAGGNVRVGHDGPGGCGKAGASVAVRQPLPFVFAPFNFNSREEAERFLDRATAFNLRPFVTPAGNRIWPYAKPREEGQGTDEFQVCITTNYPEELGDPGKMAAWGARVQALAAGVDPSHVADKFVFNEPRAAPGGSTAGG